MEEGKYRMKKLLPKEFLEDVVRLPYKPNPQDNPQTESTRISTRESTRESTKNSTR